MALVLYFSPSIGGEPRKGFAGGGHSGHEAAFLYWASPVYRLDQISSWSLVNQSRAYGCGLTGVADSRLVEPGLSVAYPAPLPMEGTLLG